MQKLAPQAGGPRHLCCRRPLKPLSASAAIANPSIKRKGPVVSLTVERGGQEDTPSSAEISGELKGCGEVVGSERVLPLNAHKLKVIDKGGIRDVEGLTTNAYIYPGLTSREAFRVPA